MIGTTDTDWDSTGAPGGVGGDIDYVLEHVNAVLRSR